MSNSISIYGVVYLGPTSEVLPYFEALGFICPPHVNPADVSENTFFPEIPHTLSFTVFDGYHCW